MELESGQFRVGKRMEGVDILRHNGANIPLCSQVSNGLVSRIRSRFQEPWPSHETARPIPLARLMARHELMEVDRSVGCVAPVSALFTAVVGQARCHRDPGTRE